MNKDIERDNKGLRVDALISAIVIAIVLVGTSIAFVIFGWDSLTQAWTAQLIEKGIVQ